MPRKSYLSAKSNKKNASLTNKKWMLYCDSENAVIRIGKSLKLLSFLCLVCGLLVFCSSFDSLVGGIFPSFPLYWGDFCLLW